MTKPQGRCVFCDGTGLTKQHIWPKWLKKINQPHITSHTQVTASANYTRPDQVTRAAKRRQGHSGSRKTRKVCKTCNNGWIEHLETRVRETVTHCMLGNPVVLDEVKQHDLAAWLILVTMMVEFTDLPTLASTVKDYVFLYENKKPPPHWKVWVARYSEDSPGAHIVRHFGIQLSEFPDVRIEPHKCDTQVTTFVIGQLCAHTFYSTEISGAEGDDYAPIDVPQLWPPTGKPINWETARRLTDNGVVSLATILPNSFPPATKSQ